MIDGILFDLDGTLWDGCSTMTKAWNETIQAHTDCNDVFTENAFKNLLGLPNDVIMESLLPMLSKEERAELEHRCNTRLHELLLTEPGKTYKGVPEMLQELSKGHKLFFISNCQQGYIETFLKVTDLRQYITGILSFGDTQNPKGMNIRQVMQEYDLKQPIYVGDMEGDGEAAAYAEVPIIYVKYGFGIIKDPDYVAEDTSEIVKIIKMKGE